MISPTPERDEPTMTDPRPELTEMLEIVWVMSELSRELIRRSQCVIDNTPLDDPLALVTAINTRDAIIISAKRKVGWERKAA